MATLPESEADMVLNTEEVSSMVIEPPSVVVEDLSIDEVSEIARADVSEDATALTMTIVEDSEIDTELVSLVAYEMF